MEAILFWIIYFTISVIILSAIFILAIRDFRATSYWKKRGVVYFPATPLLSKDILDSFLIRHTLLKKVYDYGRDEVACGFFQFRKPLLMLRSPQAIHLILNQESRRFQNKRLQEYSDGNRDPLSQHLLALNGAKWKVLRARLTPTFTSEKLRSMFPLLESCVRCFSDLVGSTAGQALDVVDMCGRLSIDAIASCAFGLELHCLRGRNQRFIHMSRVAFRAGRWRMLKAHLRGLYPAVFKMLGIKAYGKEVNHFFCSLLDQTIVARKMGGQSRPDFIHLLMNMLDQDEDTAIGEGSPAPMKFTNDLIAAQAFSFFIGGYETTSVTMSCIFYELARNERVKQKLRTEVDSVLSPSSEISYDDLKSLEYLDMVIKEVLRLHPPAFYIQRICSENFNIPGTSIIIEKDVEVYIPILEIHHDENYFPNALEFIPERFSKKQRDKIIKGSYLPFGDGPRKCIGMRFSLVELKLTLAKVVKDYNFQLVSESLEQLNLEEYSRIYKVKNKILVQFSKRQDQSSQESCVLNKNCI